MDALATAAVEVHLTAELQAAVRRAKERVTLAVAVQRYMLDIARRQVEQQGVERDGPDLPPGGPPAGPPVGVDLRPRDPLGDDDEDEGGGAPPPDGAPAGGLLILRRLKTVRR